MRAGLGHRKRQRMLVVLLGLSAFIIASLLVLFALGSESLSLFLQPSSILEKQAKGELSAGQRIRLGGLVETGSVARLEDGITYRFEVTDCAATIPVQYQNLLPDLFREGQGVVAEGVLGDDGLFLADTVLAKHDENYAPPGTIPVNTEACSHPEQTTAAYGRAPGR